MNIRIQINGQTFESSEDLLVYIGNCFPSHANFLSAWFSPTDTVDITTSGSTGKPKTITFPKEKLIKSARRTIDIFKLYEGTKTLLNLPSSFVAGKMMWIRALTGHWDLHLLDPSEKIPANLSYDFGAMVPLQIQKNPGITDNFTKLIIGGAPIADELFHDLSHRKNAIFQTYGMTETLTHVALMPLTAQAAAIIKKSHPSDKVFHALDGVSFSVDERQCLIVKDSRTDLKVTTNDIVELLDNQSFKWIGRYDHVINSGGIKFFPEQVEKKLSPYLSTQFIITAVPDKKWGDKTILVIEGTPYELPSEIFDKAGLKFYEKPKRIIFLPEFPRTASGKIKREEIRKLLLRDKF